MATSYVVPAIADRPAIRGRPRLAVVAAVAIAGLVTALCSFGLALASDGASGVQVALLEWISVPYIVAGLIAWWRRPDSRLGVLMVAGGFATGLVRAGVRALAVPHTIGVVFDILPAVLFLHVYLAFPDGRLRSTLRAGLVIGRVRRSAVGLQLVKMSLGGVGPGTCWQISTRTERSAYAWSRCSCSRSAPVPGRHRRARGAAAAGGPAAAASAGAPDRLVRRSGS